MNWRRYGPKGLGSFTRTAIMDLNKFGYANRLPFGLAVMAFVATHGLNKWSAILASRMTSYPRLRWIGKPKLGTIGFGVIWSGRCQTMAHKTKPSHSAGPPFGKPTGPPWKIQTRMQSLSSMAFMWTLSGLKRPSLIAWLIWCPISTRHSGPRGPPWTPYVPPDRSGGPFCAQPVAACPDGP